MDENSDRTRPGPDPERLKIEEDDWEDAVKKALDREKPAEAWPEEKEEEDGGCDEQ